MEVSRITGATRVLGAPEGWDKDAQGPCRDLPIRDEPWRGGNSMISAWHPTQDEIERIAKGAPIYLTVLGVFHPPVAMAVGDPPE